MKFKNAGFFRKKKAFFSKNIYQQKKILTKSFKKYLLTKNKFLTKNFTPCKRWFPIGRFDARSRYRRCDDDGTRGLF